MGGTASPGPDVGKGQLKHSVAGFLFHLTSPTVPANEIWSWEAGPHPVLTTQYKHVPTFPGLRALGAHTHHTPWSVEGAETRGLEKY